MLTLSLGSLFHCQFLKTDLFILGVIGQPALVAPPVSTHPGTTGAVARVPLGIESSSHPSSGVALVRPVPQQASPVRVNITNICSSV